MRNLTLRVCGVVFGLFLLAGCGSADVAIEEPPGEPADVLVEEVSDGSPVGWYGSLEDLRDAAVDAGYVCEEWVADNVVTLAAESGSCDRYSVFSTYASEADLQAQLDQAKELDAVLLESGIETTPMLVGENWIIKAPEAAELRDAMGGTLVGSKQP